MKDENEKNSLEQDAKAPYEAPKVVRVSLRPEEAVLGHCKITGGSGPVAASCRYPVACPSMGS
jgi:hypothetical protein